jgi:RNA polymerase sigma-70 factor (ECF subfamily)
MDLDVHLAAIVAGDAGAFARWLAGAEPRVRASLRSFAAVVDVEAVLQEALVRVWQVAPRFTPDGAPNGLVRFAVRIARNLAVSELRRRKETEVVAGDVAIEPVAPDPLLRRAILECRDKLPPKPRQALDARLEAGGTRDDGELAEALEMKLNTFLQNVTRARQLIADCLARRGIAVALETPA